MTKGLYRHPTIHGDTIVFVSEDDLWTVPASGGTAQRLTANLGEISHPRFSPDGASIAFASREEGPAELFVLPAAGGPARRLTYLGSSIAGTAAWSRDGRQILFFGNGGQAFMRVVGMYEVPASGGLPRELLWRTACYAALGPRGAVVLGLYGLEPARWKRYRGGRAGRLLIDPDGRGAFRPLIQLDGQLSSPMWIGSRVPFLSDREGTGNLYSCTPDGKGLRRHTDHDDFYARHAQTDGRRIVYYAGGDLWLFDGHDSTKLDVSLPSSRVQRNRRYADAGRHLEDYAPEAKRIAVTARGRVFSMAHWEGPVTEVGGLRTRLARFLKSGDLVAVTDVAGEEQLLVRGKTLKSSFGRAIDLKVSPTADHVAIANHRFELVHVDLKTGRTRILDKSPYDRITGLAWSPDGKWVAYGFADSMHRFVLKLVELRSGKSRLLARPVLRDMAPAFDPDGRYLYFLSYREFDPVYDNLHFDLGFPRGMRPYLVTLRRDLRSPFDSDWTAPDPKKKEKFRIDLDGIEDRVVPFPVAEGKFDQIEAIPGAAVWTCFPVEGALSTSWATPEPPSRGTLEKWDLAKRKTETIAHGVAGFRVGGGMMAIRCGRRLRLIKAGEKADDHMEKEPPGRESGWIDLRRPRVLVEPPAEWRQMLRECWRLLRDHFWQPDMSGVDWDGCWKRYSPLVDRVGSRAEYSDLVWEMIGELGTSHCYEMGGDYRPEPRYHIGHLGAEYAWAGRGWKITRIHRGDPWAEEGGSPLLAPGVNLRAGDVITAIEGRPCAKDRPPGEHLLNRAGQEVVLTLASRRTVTVRALRDETRVRYREWVEGNRRRVHERTKGRVGYVHVPDMGANGYAEFHRAYLSEVDREALVIDVRFNGGGHVSQLLLEKLARRRLGYDIQRWGRPSPYPGDSPAGPLVALTNESAGSDGDIFSHCFKLLKLGPLIGRRTWGGVIGIWPRHFLADGSITTQPEFSFWFKDVGFGVENYGTDPDLVVELLPQDLAAGRDPQLEKGIAVALDLLKTHKPLDPDVRNRPNLRPPRLPRRVR